MIHANEARIVGILALLLNLFSAAQAADRGTLNSGETWSGLEIAAPSFTDTWTFQGSANGQAIVAAVPTTGALDTCIVLYPPGGGAAEADTCGSGDDLLDVRLQLTGLYTVAIRDVSLGEAGTYNISLLTVPGAVASAADPDGGPLASGATLSGTINVASDIDAIQTYGYAGDRAIVTAVMTATANPGTLAAAPAVGSFDLCIVLYPPGGGAAEAETCSSGGDLLDVQLQVTGLYTVVIRDAYLGESGPYSVSLQTIPGAVTSAGDPDGGQLAAGETLGGAIDVASDMDAFVTYGAAGDQVILTAVTTAGSLDTCIVLYPPGGGAAEADTCGFGDDLLDVQLQTTGLYTAVIRDALLGASGAYSLSLSKIPADVRPGLYNPSPQDGSGVNCLNGSFGWDSVPGATGYDLFFREGVGAPYAKIGENLATPSLPFPAMEPGSTSFWRVIAHTAAADIPGPVWWFVVLAENQPPVADDQATSTNEDTATSILLSASDVDNDSLTYAVVTSPAHGTLSGTAPNLTYQPAANYYGPDSFTFNASDCVAASNIATVSIAIAPVNDAPSFVKGANQTVLEDAGARTVAGWATRVNAGAANEATQTLTFTATNNNNALFSVQPAVAANGTLTYTPAANAFGSATVTVTLRDNGGTANGGVDTSAAKSFTITVTGVNDAPSFVKGANQTVLEDAGARTVAGWATGISAGANEAAQTLTFTATNNNNALFSVQPAVAVDGTLTYTPRANAFGSATVTVTLKDSGGTANGGVDTSAAKSFTITVTGVNDAPSFVKGANQTVLEDAGARTVAAWATGMRRGPANEGAQTLSFTVTNGNGALFSVQPAVAANGTLTYTPRANAFGSATVTVTLKDSGGTANGGVDTSAAKSFTITVTGVNDAPSFVKGANQTVLEDAGARTVAGWATGISAGANEAAQTLTFTATNNNNALFSVQPAVAVDGTLTYTPRANAFGSATVTVTLKDSGGTANGGVDTSAAKSFTITVTGVNDAPTTMNATVSTPKNTDKVFAVGDFPFTDVDTGDSLQKVKVVSLPGAGTLYRDGNQNGRVDAGEAVLAGGDVIAADITAGRLKFKPAVNASGTPYASFKFKVNDGRIYSALAATMRINVPA